MSDKNHKILYISQQEFCENMQIWSINDLLWLWVGQWLHDIQSWVSKRQWNGPSDIAGYWQGSIHSKLVHRQKIFNLPEMSLPLTHSLLLQENTVILRIWFSWYIFYDYQQEQNNWQAVDDEIL